MIEHIDVAESACCPGGCDCEATAAKATFIAGLSESCLQRDTRAGPDRSVRSGSRAPENLTAGFPAN